MAFLTVHNFFCAISKMPTKKHLLVHYFLKLNQSWNMKNKFLGGGFLQNQKRTFWGVQNGTCKKSNFKFIFLRLFFYVKGSFLPIFTKKILIFGPSGIFLKWKLWRVCDGARSMRALKFWNWPSKIIPYLWVLDLFSLIKKKFHTPPYYTVLFM